MINYYFIKKIYQKRENILWYYPMAGKWGLITEKGKIQIV